VRHLKRVSPFSLPNLANAVGGSLTFSLQRGWTTFPRWAPPLRRSGLSIAPRCPVISSLRGSDLSIAPRFPVIPSLRRSDLSIAPRCPVIPSLRSDLSARCARGPAGLQVTPEFRFRLLPACYREDTPNGVWTEHPTGCAHHTMRVYKHSTPSGVVYRLELRSVTHQECRNLDQIKSISIEGPLVTASRRQG